MKNVEFAIERALNHEQKAFNEIFNSYWDYLYSFQLKRTKNEELAEEMAGFPFMSNDDLVDSTVMALLRFRQGGFIRLPSDEWDDEPQYHYRREYY